MADPPTRATTGPPPTRRRRERARLLAVAILAAAATAFALLNFRTVRVNFIVTTGHPPLIVVIVACLAIGIVIGLFGGRRPPKGKRKL